MMERVLLQAPYRKFTQKLVLKRIGYLTEQIRIMILTLMWKRVWSTVALALPTPAAQSMVFVITRSLIAMRITNFENPLIQGQFPNTS